MSSFMSSYEVALVCSRSCEHPRQTDPVRTPRSWAKCEVDALRKCSSRGKGTVPRRGHGRFGKAFAQMWQWRFTKRHSA
eukprot:Skav210358  [mRNA]  locus=scaffold2370:111673:113700:- [translate_table: standard]